MSEAPKVDIDAVIEANKDRIAASAAAGKAAIEANAPTRALHEQPVVQTDAADAESGQHLDGQ